MTKRLPAWAAGGTPLALGGGAVFRPRKHDFCTENGTFGTKSIADEDLV
jgi:hypothetical protein